MAADSNTPEEQRPGSSSAGEIRLPGEGFSVWVRDLALQKVPTVAEPSVLRSSLAPKTPAKQAAKKAVEESQPAPAKPVRLPGEGFSVWTRPAPEPKAATGLRLPGQGFSVWTSPGAPAPAPASKPAPKAEPAAQPVAALAAAAVAEPASRVTFYDDDQPSRPGLVGRILGKLSFLQWAALLLFLALVWGFLSKTTEAEKSQGRAEQAEQEKTTLLGENEDLSNRLTDARSEAASRQRQIADLQTTFSKEREGLQGQVTQLQGELDGVRKDFSAKQAEWTGRLATLAKSKETLEQQMAERTASWDNAKTQYESEAGGLREQVATLTQSGEELQAKLAAAEQSLGAAGQEKSGLEQSVAQLKGSLASAMEFNQAREEDWKQKLAAAAEESGVTKTLQTQLANAEIAYQKSVEEAAQLRQQVEQTAAQGAAQAAALQEQVQNLSGLRDKLLEELQKKEAELAKSADLQGDRDKARANAAEFESRVKELESALTQAREDFGARESALKEQVAALNGFKEKVTASLAEREQEIEQLKQRIADADKRLQDAQAGAGAPADVAQELGALKSQLDDMRIRLRVADEERQKWMQFLEEFRVRAEQLQEGVEKGKVIIERPQP